MNFKLHNNSDIDPIDLKFDSYIAPVELENTNKIKKNEDVNTDISSDLSFAHLHVHSQFSVLQATTDINNLINKAGDGYAYLRYL